MAMHANLTAASLAAIKEIVREATTAVLDKRSYCLQDAQIEAAVDRVAEKILRRGQDNSDTEACKRKHEQSAELDAIDEAIAKGLPMSVPVVVEEYLGDGVYAVYNGYAITLDLRGQDNFASIVLEPEVYRNLVKFAKRVGLQQTES